MITLTENEIRHLATNPEGLAAAMDYHDWQMTLGEPMGFDCSAHQKRYDELKAERLELSDREYENSERSRRYRFTRARGSRFVFSEWFGDTSARGTDAAGTSAKKPPVVSE